MNFQFTHPSWLLLLPVCLGWVLWLAFHSDVQISNWRRWSALALRLFVLTALIFAVAGLQWLRPIEGVNVLFLLDRSDSIPTTQQEAAHKYILDASKTKKPADQTGILVFGTDASIEMSPNPIVDLPKIQAVVGTERTDIASAIRLGTAAFPETGQKRIVLLSDGNENIGDALTAILSAKPLGVSIDVAPLGVSRSGDVSVQKLSLPNNLKKGQTFEVKIFAQADRPQNATVRLYRNNQLLGDQKVELAEGKNLFTFPQTLTEPGFYSYDVALEGTEDRVAQNNRAVSFTSVRGDPSVLIVSNDPAADARLAAALRSAQLDVKITDLSGFPTTLAEMQNYDSIFLSNLAAGDLGRDWMKLLESAVRDFGVGLVCVGGDQTYAAGGYRDTPLERVLPVDMELSSKKVLPSGALVLIMHGMEFNNGNQVARDIAAAALDALGPQDEMGVVLWDGIERWLFELAKVGDKTEIGRKIAGMNQGDLPHFEKVLTIAHTGLKKSTSNLKHIIVFSDGDPGPPSPGLMQSIVNDKITVSSVLIAGHAGPETMIAIAEQGRGRFYNVDAANELPQIFIKEAAVILKSAIFEEPFIPQLTATTEPVRGIGSLPTLLGYVATTAKPRAEIPLLTDKGDPLLAHWQFGLGRAVAFTSDAKAKWARDWITWNQYQQFWSQIAKWSLRRLENEDFTTDVSVQNGEGHIAVDALTPDGNFRNFLNLQAIAVSPKGERQTVQLEQTGPGHYEAKFPTRDVGAYLIHLMEMQGGNPVRSQVLGASVNYSPEFSAAEPNHNLLRRLAETGSGKVLNLNNPAESPFLHDRQKTFQPNDLWEWLLRLAIIVFPLDVGIRRIQIDRAEWLKATQNLRRLLFFWRRSTPPPQTEESLGALLARREQVRASQPMAAPASLTQPDPTLFQPNKPIILSTPDPARPEPTSTTGAASSKPVAPSPAEPASTTSRLLEAKRRAQKRIE